MQVELAHGGRGQSSGDRRGGYRGGGGYGGGGGGGSARFGVSRHSEFRGLCNEKIGIGKVWLNLHMFLMVRMYSWTALCSYCAWASIICFMARFEGVMTTTSCFFFAAAL